MLAGRDLAVSCGHPKLPRRPIGIATNVDLRAGTSVRYCPYRQCPRARFSNPKRNAFRQRIPPNPDSANAVYQPRGILRSYGPRRGRQFLHRRIYILLDNVSPL
jgi:hypothetical protein